MIRQSLRVLLSTGLLSLGLLAGIAATPAVSQDKAAQMSGLSLSNDKPIQIESDNLEIREQDKKAVFSGNVKVAQDKTTLRAGNMVVFYSAKGGSVSSGKAAIDRIVVSGKVVLSSGTQNASADKGVFDMGSEVLVLEGKSVVLSQGQNVFTGCKLTVQMKSGQARLESCGGRVRIQLDPKTTNSN